MQPRRHPPSRPDAEPPIYPRRLSAIIAIAVALHLNYWLWDADRLVLGLPINLFYHVLLTLALPLLMLTLVRGHWPSFLDDEGRE